MLYAVYWEEGLIEKLLHLQKLKLTGGRSITAKKVQCSVKSKPGSGMTLQKGRMFTISLEFGALGLNGCPL